VLDFQTPATGSLDTVNTTFGRGTVPTASGKSGVDLIAYHESSIIDRDLVAAGLGGTVLGSTSDSNIAGTGVISLQGALGTSISFDYGMRGDQQTATKGGFTAYTYDQHLLDNGLYTQPIYSFKEFNLGVGAPIGPATITGLNNASGSTAGYFNTFQWTSSTAYGDVFTNDRAGQAQIAHVTLTVEPALDLLTNSVHVTTDGATIRAVFKPIGVNGPVPLRDLAAALGGDHFNWVQYITQVPGHWIYREIPLGGSTPQTISRPILDPTQNPLSQRQVTSSLPSLAGQVIHPSSEYVFDNHQPYYNTNGVGTSAITIGQHTSTASLNFGDKPSRQKGWFQPGEYMYFQTELALVDKNDNVLKTWHNIGTNFTWRSNATFADIPELGYDVTNPDDPNLPPIIAGGVDDVQVDTASPPGDQPPVTNPDSASTTTDAPVTIPILANDSDPGGTLDPGSVEIFIAPASGKAVPNADGTITYTPDGTSGDITFGYTVQDSQGAVSAPATVTVHVAPGHTPVLAIIDGQTVLPGSPLTFTASANDPDGDPLTYSLGPGAPAGTAINPSSGVLTWTPTAAQAGEVYNISVVVTDNEMPPLSATQSVPITVLNKLQAVAVTVLTTPSPGPMQIAVDFNEAVQTAPAQDVGNYRIVSAGDVSLPIQSAVYTDTAAQHRVVLTVAAGTAVVPDLYHVSIDAAHLSARNGDQGAPNTDQLWVDVTSENTLKPITVQPDGSFGIGNTSESLGYAPPLQIVAGNFAGNGNTDLVVITSGRHEEIINGNDTFVYDPVLLMKSNGDGTYAPPVPIALGGQYQAVGIWSVDWNHDGAPDLVVGVASNFDEFVHPQTEQFYVLLNDGHGNFTNAPETPIPVADPQSDYLGANGISPFQATGLYDLSGNGNIDIVHLGQLVGNAGPDFPGTGDFNLEVIGKDQYVGYTPQMELPLGINDGIQVAPSQLYFADLNGDGKPDIIARDSGYYVDAPNFTVILSTPTGYAPGVTIRDTMDLNSNDIPAFNPVALGVGHFTGSGYNDIAVIFGGDIEIFRNDGHGNFTEQAPIHLAYGANAASFSDVNNDGVPDLVMTTALGDSSTPTQLGVWTLIANGHGGFTPTTTAPIALAGNDPSAPSAITMSDLDHDGFLDLVLGRSTSGAVVIAMNDGTGTLHASLQPPPSVGVLGGSDHLPGFSKLAFGDFNNDGVMDFVAASRYGVDIFLAQTGGGFRQSQFLPDAFAGYGTPWVKVADVNNDGIPDIVLGYAGMNVYLGNGDGTFRPAPVSAVQPPSGSSIFTVTLADVNNDGNLDAVALLNTQGAYSYGVFFGDGKGDFTFNANTVIPIQTGFIGPTVYIYQRVVTPILGDFNGDGKLDLLVPTYDAASKGYSLTDYLGNGDGTFTPGPVVYTGAGSADIKLLVADLNGDGKLDIVAFTLSDYDSNSYTPLANVFLGDGHGGFHEVDSINLALANPNIFPVDLVLGDYSGDGKLDLAASYADFFANPAQVDIYTGDGAGHFAAPQAVTVGVNPNNLVSIPRAPFLDAGTFAVTDQPPTAKDETIAAFAGSSVTIPVLDDATNPDGAPLTITQVTNPAHGVAHVVAGPPDNPADEIIVYAPAAGFTGTDTFTYTIADPAGVESTATVTATVTLALTPPSQPATPVLVPADDSGTKGDGITDDTSPSLTGMTQANATVQLLNSANAVVATTTADASGNYVFAVPGAPLSPGAYPFTVVASNAAGSSPVSSPFTLTIVPAPTTPSAPTLLPADSDGSPGGETTTLTSPYLTGTTIAAATVQLLNTSGTVLNTTQSDTSGGYEVQVPGPLGLGPHTYLVRVVDRYGDVSSPSAAQTITVRPKSTQPPSQPARPVLVPADDSGTKGDGITDDASPAFAGTTEANATVQLLSGTKLVGATTADASGAYVVSVANPLSPGTYKLAVVAANSGGSSKPSQPLSLTIVPPPTMPSAPTLLPADSNRSPGGETTTLTSPYLTGTTTARATVQLLNTSGTVLNTAQSNKSSGYQVQVPGPLGLGPHTYLVRVVDRYGDVSSPSAARTIMVVNPPAPVVKRAIVTTKKASIQSIIVTYSEPMTVSSVDNLKSYTLLDAGSSHIFGAKGNAGITIKTVIYSPATRSATLTLAKSVPTSDSLRLTINAQPPRGLQATNGQFLNEAANGKPGANFVAYLGAPPKKTTTPSKALKNGVTKAGPLHVVANGIGAFRTSSAFPSAAISPRASRRQ